MRFGQSRLISGLGYTSHYKVLLYHGLLLGTGHVRVVNVGLYFIFLFSFCFHFLFTFDSILFRVRV